MLNFYDFSRKELAEYLESELDLPSYRADQIFDWVYKKNSPDFSKMSNLSEELRGELSQRIDFKIAECLKRQISNDGTRKFLYQVPSGQSIETVLINQPRRKTLCLSSQYGCGMGCTFCQTGTMGFRANLKTSDIIGQVLAVKEDCLSFDDDFQNIVFMGMGEPLHNYKEVVRALKILIDPHGIEFPAKKITVSSVGLVPAIKKFAQEDLGINLAVSLNATTDQVRSEIMPINKAFPIETLMSTLREFPVTKRKRITIEYVLLKGVNDSDADLKRLANLLSDLHCRINLIPYNENTGLGFETPSEDNVYKWQVGLERKNYLTTVRWSKGKDIDAACGQLAVENNSAVM